MFEIYTYEFIRAANEERLNRSLRRHQRLSSTAEEIGTPHVREAEVVELVFATGCADELSA